MTNDTTSQVQPPSLLLSVATRLGALALGPAVLALANFAGLTQAQQGQLTTIGLACITALVSYGWVEFQAYAHRKNANARVAQAAASAAPTPPTS